MGRTNPSVVATVCEVMPLESLCIQTSGHPQSKTICMGQLAQLAQSAAQAPLMRHHQSKLRALHPHWCAAGAPTACIIVTAGLRKDTGGLFTYLCPHWHCLSAWHPKVT